MDVSANNINRKDKIHRHTAYKNRLVNEDGLMFPNFTQGCVEWLIKLGPSLKNFSVYEWGAEAASSWWKERSNDYTGVTTSEGAAKLMDCVYRWDMDNYVEHITQDDKLYDVIIINGRWRDECTVQALQRVRKGGYIIINNYCQEGTEFKPMYWEMTTNILDRYPVVIFHDEISNTNNRTAIWQIVK